MEQKKRISAFVTTKKGTCYLTVKMNRRNYPIMRIYAYKMDAQDKRRMVKLHPEVQFDWKKISVQLAEKREECRRYRSRRRKPKSVERGYEPYYAVYEPGTRTVYTSGEGNELALLDAILQLDRVADKPMAASKLKRKLELFKK